MTPHDSLTGQAGPPARWVVRLVALLLVLAGALAIGANRSVAQDTGGPVHVATIAGAIDLGLAPYLQRVLGEAEQADAAAVVIVIDTPGGRLDAVLQMRDALLDSSVRTVAFVDRSAFSAGALLALASHEIHLAPGSSLGAATPVDAGTGAPADAKVISAVRSTFRATALERGRDPLVGEAMVDPDVEIDGLVDAGSLLTLTTDQAADVGYSDGLATDLDDLLATLDLADREVVTVDPRPAERLVRLLTNGIVGSLLLTLGALLIIGELFAGAFGIASLFGLGFLTTFFYGHMLAGLAGWEDVVLVGLGIVLLLVEILVVPGFGVPGILGLSGVLGGGFLAMTSRDFDFVSTSQLLGTASTIAITFLVVTIGLVVLLTALSRRGRPAGRRLPGGRAADRGSTPRRGWLRWFGDGDVLAAEDDGEVTDGDTESDAARQASRAGAIGTALSDLRPAGVADFGGHRVDVVTEGDYLVAGDRVEVIRAERYRRVVRRARD